MKRKTKRQIDWSPVRLTFSAQFTRAFLYRLLVIFAVPILLGGLLQACGGGGGGAAPSNINSITIDPVSPSIAHGTNIQLHATVNFKNKTTKDVTESATWVSADSTVANVSNVAGTKGLSTGAGVGATTVTVKFQGKKGTSAFTVTNATLTAITITPATPVIAKGTTVQLSAIGDFSNGSTQDLTNQVAWGSGNSGIATVSTASGTQGLVTGANVGNTPITATLNGIAGSTTVTVSAATLTSITITPPTPSLANGTTLQLTATCNLSDGTTQDCTSEASWTSSGSGIAEVSDTAPTKGLVTGVGAGNSTIIGSFAGLQGSATVTVTGATLVSITVLPDPSIAKGTTVQLTATGKFSDGTTQDLTDQVSWTSGDNAIAQVSNIAGTQGLVTALSVGNTSITAALNGIQGSTTVTVTAATLTSITIFPATVSVASGTNQQLTAIGTFSDGTTQDLTHSVNWTATPADTLTVDPNGLLTGTKVGNGQVNAVQGAVTGQTSATVTSAILVTIVVSPSNQSIKQGTKSQLTATGAFSDGTIEDLTASASWMSSAVLIASVGSMGLDPGLVTGVSAGGATITATQGGVSGTATVTVAPLPVFAYLTNDTSNTVSVFSVGSDGTLTPIFGSPFTNPGAQAASVTVDPSGKFLYTANLSGTVTAFAITQSGPNIGALTLIGTVGPFPGAAVPFGITVVPSGSFAYVGNVAGNSVSGFSINPVTGALTPIAGSPFSTSPASGPEGMAAYMNGDFVYTAASGSNQVAGFGFNTVTGALTPIPGSPFPPPADVSHPQSITFDRSGNFAYTANDPTTPGPPFGFGNVSAYRVDFSTGLLTFVGNVDAGTAAGGPMMVAVDPFTAASSSGPSKFAYVAGGGDVFAFNIVAGTGELSAITGSPFPAGINPKWVAVDPSGKFVYVANHGASSGPVVPDGSVSAYQIGTDGAPTPITGLSPLPRGASSITVVAVP
jgi:6-phosphogluconolactonase (cycloisomerase 2 family)/uncharacterized protein YjdB